MCVAAIVEISSFIHLTGQKQVKDPRQVRDPRQNCPEGPGMAVLNNSEATVQWLP